MLLLLIVAIIGLTGYKMFLEDAHLYTEIYFNKVANKVTGPASPCGDKRCVGPAETCGTCPVDCTCP